MTILSQSPVQTEELARNMARMSGPGDTLLLSGAIGTGKTVFARAFIRLLLNRPGAEEDIPSPTYTLVQTYSADGNEIWHADLYRLNSPCEAVELGLDEVLGRVTCLIEWPERLADMLPRHAHAADFCMVESGENLRRITVKTWSRKLHDRLSLLEGSSAN